MITNLDPDTQTRYYEMLNKCETNNDKLNGLLKKTAQEAPLSAPAEAQLPAQPARTATQTPAQTAEEQLSTQHTRTATPKVKPTLSKSAIQLERNPLKDMTTVKNLPPRQDTSSSYYSSTAS